MMDVVNSLASPLSLVVLLHGMAASMFVVLFLLAALGVTLPLLTDLLGPPSMYSTSTAVGTSATSACGRAPPPRKKPTRS